MSDNADEKLKKILKENQCVKSIKRNKSQIVVYVDRLHRERILESISECFLTRIKPGKSALGHVQITDYDGVTRSIIVKPYRRSNEAGSRTFEFVLLYGIAESYKLSAIKEQHKKKFDNISSKLANYSLNIISNVTEQLGKVIHVEKASDYNLKVTLTPEYKKNWVLNTEPKTDLIVFTDNDKKNISLKKSSNAVILSAQANEACALYSVVCPTLDKELCFMINRFLRPEFFYVFRKYFKILYDSNFQLELNNIFGFRSCELDFVKSFNSKIFNIINHPAATEEFRYNIENTTHYAKVDRGYIIQYINENKNKLKNVQGIEDVQFFDVLKTYRQEEIIVFIRQYIKDKYISFLKKTLSDDPVSWKLIKRMNDYSFRKEVVKESLTGQNKFNENEGKANYILTWDAESPTESSCFPIDDYLIDVYTKNVRMMITDRGNGRGGRLSIDVIAQKQKLIKQELLSKNPK